MLTIYGRKQRFCDGVSRRSFMKIGGFSLGALGGLTLSDLLRAEAATEKGNSHKAVINIFLGGGPPHQDMWEIKTEAPREIRGEFNAISTSCSDVRIGECFPKIAASFEKFAAIRSVVGCSGAHDAYQCLSGWERRSLDTIGGRPAIGRFTRSRRQHVIKFRDLEFGIADQRVVNRVTLGFFDIL